MGGLQRRTPLRRTATLKRSTPLSPRNIGRRARRFAEAFGERGAAVRGRPCLCRGRSLTSPCSGPVEAAHARSRGAGGSRRDLVPLCRGHHREQHRRGVRTFAATYQLDLDAEARRIAVELDEEGLP